MGDEKVNDMGAQGKSSRLYKSDTKKEAKYLDREMESYQAKGQGSNRTLGTQGKEIKVRTNMGSI